MFVFKIKKYFLIFLLVFIIAPGVVFSLPSVEVYKLGDNSYPKVQDVQVSYSQADNNVTIIASATDVSGVLSVSARINLAGVQIGGLISMQPVGSECNLPGVTCDYIVILDLDVSAYGDGTYTVGFTVTDNLGNSNPDDVYSNMGSFVLGQKTVEIWTDKAESGWGSDSSNPQDPYNVFYHDSRAQFIVSAADLDGAGLTPGSNINSIFLKTYQQPGRDLANFRIKAKLTTAILTTSWEGGWTTLFGPVTASKDDSDLAVQGNWKEYTFSQDFSWDGISNIMFDISRDDNAYTSNGGMYIRENVGTSRMFAGYSDSGVDGDGLEIPYRISGSLNGNIYSYGPSLKITFAD